MTAYPDYATATDPARAATRANQPAAARGMSRTPDTHAPAPQPLTATVLNWRIVVEAGRHRAVCAACDWACPVHGCCGATAVRAAYALHTACAGGPRLTDRPAVAS